MTTAALLAVLLLVPRPVLSGAESLLDTVDGRWKIHYTTVGADAALHGALDAEVVARGLTAVAGHWVDRVGMRSPLPDDGAGGDARVDVYLRRLGGERGDTEPVDVGAGVRASAWIQLETRTAGVSTTRLAAAAAHEATHAIEYAYRASASPWIYEASAAYVEHAGFDDPTLAAETDAHWSALLGHPEVPLDTVDGSHEYDAMVFVKFLVDAARDEGALRRVWEGIGATGDVDASVTAATAGAPDLATALARFAGWNLHACAADDGRHYDARAAACHAPVRAATLGIAVPSSRVLPLAPRAIGYLEASRPPCGPVEARFDHGGDVALVDDAGAVTRLAAAGTTVTLGEGATPEPIAVAAGAAGGPALTLMARALVACADASSDGEGDAATPTTMTVAPGCQCAAVGERPTRRSRPWPCAVGVVLALVAGRALRCGAARRRGGRARRSPA